ncbi:uncharacterized protein LOC105229233 isoform X2 [Bactrocera dorsalis]|uniref:Uncharacterized protein LOC105229233 isoform X2 n=1 Tax=Bactrocera dorsalis TaxID=27457 RepID=A0A6I9W4D4_BACDO|nr:uncharacterized protein LOC105229233 isoform X2 [Bactrocera dorsalis]
MQTTNQNTCDTAETSIATTKTENEFDTTATTTINTTTNTKNEAFANYNVVVDNLYAQHNNLNELAVNTTTTNTLKTIAATPMDQRPQLDEDNENCVIDIATMQIADDSNNTATMPALSGDSNNKCSYKNEHSESGGERMAGDAKGEIDTATDAEMESDGDGEGDGEGEEGGVQIEAEPRSDNEEEEVANQYLNEIEISKVDEEQIITELVDASGQGSCTEAKQSNGMRVAFGIILRLMLPLANSVMRSFKGIRDVRFQRVLRSITSSRQVLTNLMAFAANSISLNLSSVHDFSYKSNRFLKNFSQRIEPILKLLKIRQARDGIESLPDMPSIDIAPCFPTATPPPTPSTPGTPTMPILSPFLNEPSIVMANFSTDKRKATPPHTPAPKCCTIKILAEPPPGQPIRADIVFIHGLHGSLVNTWKQGLWENERQPENFERPPKPPVRPPKRPKHSRTALLHPPHKQKRARFAQGDPSQRATLEAMESDEINNLDDGFFDATEHELKEGVSYVCGAPEDIQNCDGIEYSFPTFRLRLNDNGRLLQGKFDKMHDSSMDGCAGESHVSQAPPASESPKAKSKGKAKPSANDPNYSKCWPGDWLPLDCPGVRVIAVNYTTDQYLWRPLWKKKEPRSNLIERAREMTELLIKHRIGCGRPIVWVGHSKGGLFIKQIIVNAWESGRPAVAPLWRSSRGVFFYSVPHRGSHLACIKAPLLARSVEMLDIEKNNKYLLDLHRRFAGLYHLGHIKIEVFSFVETALTLMSVLYLRIVGVDSADPGFGDVCGIRLDHREICKPRSRDCILYKELVKMIKKVY